MIEAIVAAVGACEGADISHADVVDQDPRLEAYTRNTELRIVPSSGIALEHNGEGIRHAKYSASKSVAVLWDNIGGVVYATFDDHAPVAYHRAIRYIRDLRLGRSPSPQRARTRRSLIEKLENPARRKHAHWNPRDKYYK